MPVLIGNILLQIFATYISLSLFSRCIATSKMLNKVRRSEPGQLSVLPLTTVPESPQFLPLGMASPNLTVLVGEDLTIYCPAKGWPTPTVNWLFGKYKHCSNSVNKWALQYNHYFCMLFLDGVKIGSTNELVLKNATKENSGNYSCTAFNSEGQIFQVNASFNRCCWKVVHEKGECVNKLLVWNILLAGKVYAAGNAIAYPEHNPLFKNKNSVQL